VLSSCNGKMSKIYTKPWERPALCMFCIFREWKEGDGYFYVCRTGAVGPVWPDWAEFRRLGAFFVFGTIFSKNSPKSHLRSRFELPFILKIPKFWPVISQDNYLVRLHFGRHLDNSWRFFSQHCWSHWAWQKLGAWNLCSRYLIPPPSTFFPREKKTKKNFFWWRIKFRVRPRDCEK
jgi:hypothetical protein